MTSSRYILFFCLLLGTASGASARTSSSFSDETGLVSAPFASVRVVYSVESARDGRFISHVMLTNMTSATIQNWKMYFQMDAVITEIEHVTWASVDTLFNKARTEWTVMDNLYEVEGAGWTHRIGPGEVVWFTINGVLVNTWVETPRTCVFDDLDCTFEAAPTNPVETADPDDLMISAWIDEEGVTTYRGHIIIQNPTDYDVEDWTMTYTSTSFITTINQVDWFRSGTSYQTSGTGWTSTIPANGFVWFDYEGVHAGTPSLPTNCSFDGVNCVFLEPDRLVDTCCKLELRVEVYCLDDGTFTALFFLSNPDQQHLDYWKLRFNWTADVTDMEGVEWSQSGDNFTVVGIGPKKRVLAGRDVWWEVHGTYSDSVEPPTDCTVNGRACTIESIGTHVIEEEPVIVDPEPPGPGPDPDPTLPSCAAGGAETSLLPDIDFRFLSVTGDRYIALVEIANNTDGLILGWRLGFSLINGMSVTRFWNGIMTVNGNNYEVTNTGDNHCIGPGKSVTFGFEGGHTGTFAEPLGCQFDTRSCIFQRMTNTATDTEDESVPDNFLLGPAYPNPFNPRTNLEVRVARTQRVTIELWDVQGRSVLRLFDDVIAAGSPVTIRVDGTNLVSGLYFMRMVGSLGLSTTRSVVLQK